jgi:RHS repeat-associated protein
VSGTFYIYSFDGRLLAEYNLLGQLVRDYVYFGGRLVAEYRGGALYYYASDQINSTRIVTDSGGNVVYSAAHEPYGGIQKTWTPDFDPELKFSGKPRDAESELDYFGPRYYDRSQFRLLSPNSISAGSGFAPASHAWNAYSYPGNHPWAEAYVSAGWMVSATNVEAVIPYRPPKPEPEIPWWTISYPWVTRAEDSLWVMIKSSGEKFVFVEHDWIKYRRIMDKADDAKDEGRSEDFNDYKEGAQGIVWRYISGYKYGSDPVFDAYLADYGMSSDPDNPLSFWNPCYVWFHLYYGI